MEDNEQKEKKKLIKETLLNLNIGAAIMKDFDLIEDYKVDLSFENERIAEDGEKEFDVHINYSKENRRIH